MTITMFRGQYAWLSTFYPANIEVTHLGDVFCCETAEHGFQVFKSTNLEDAIYVCSAPTPGQAKRRGREITRRPDWEQNRNMYMRQVLELKFSQPDLMAKLISTGHEDIVEVNVWHDTYWGVCNGIGSNWLGILLMSVRKQMALHGIVDHAIEGINRANL